MNMLKRSLAMLLVLTMLFSFVPFSVFADDGESVETTAVTEAVEQRSGGPGNSDFGHSQGNGKDKHKDPLKETEAPEVTEAPTETTVPETTVPETTVPETTVPETTVPETTVPETTVPETTVPETTVPETTQETVPETTEATVPETTEATEETTEPTEEATEPVEELQPVVFSLRAGSFMKVFHLDCGRKYFTVDQVKELIDAISNVGFSHMELAIGNDGLRLLLDDMTVTANGKTYNSDTIKSGIKSGNQAYSHSGEWTQSEMDTIIAYAETKGIEIIPLVNNPGHMDSILAAMKACGINGYYESSKRTVDLENAEAVAFTQALVMKYAKYFASKGCSYFNIGADEYANDYHKTEATGMGFGYLIDNNKYGNFITYVNALVEDIMALGMTPIAFNDGIYFRENTSFGTFNSNLMVAAWTGGYSGIKPASTTFLANKGHQLLNTNERWYYVLGRKQATNSTYCYESALSNAKSESVTTVTDHQGNTPIGAMQCVWCDDPSVNYETYKSNVMTLISTLAANNTTYFTGPNVVEPAPEPDVPEDVGQTDEETGIVVTGPGLTDVTVKAVAEDAMTEVKNVIQSNAENAVADQVRAWDITPATADGAYTKDASVTVPVPADWTNVRGGVLASEHGEKVLDIAGELKDGFFTFTVPHFSTVVAYELKTAAERDYNVLVELTVGQTSQTYTDNSGYHTTAEGLNTAVATATLGGNAGSEATVKYVEADVSCNDLISSNSTSWVVATDYFYTPDNGVNYYPVYAKRSSQWQMFGTNYTYTWGYSTAASATNVKQIDSQTTTNRNSDPNITVYAKSGTEAVPAQTTVSFTGVSAGETTATIGSTTYKIVVSKGNIIDTITVGDSKVYTDNSTNITVDNESIVAATPDGNGKLTITAKAAGAATVTTDNAVYTITVVEFDPATVTPLTVEYWITNIVTRTVESTTENPVTTQQISAAAAGVATAEGADINAMMPEWTIKKDGDSGEDRQVEFWHVRLLDKTQTNNSSSGKEEQTTQSADDETTNGDAVTRVRYYDPGDGNGRRWQMLSGSTWLDVNQTKNQIVAYYMEVVDIQNANGTTELHVNAADWGKLGDNSPASSYADTSKYCSISLQIVYEDGSGNPATTTADDLDSKTLIFNYWDNGRGIGTFAFDTLGQFNIYQITAETGAVNVTFTGGAWGTAQVNSFSWDNNEKVVWSGESETASIYNNTSHPSNADPKDNLMWNENKEAILIRVYVKAVKTEDSLNVVYIDEKFNDTLYSYHIQVEAGHNFNDNMQGNPDTMDNSRIDVTGCGIENVYGQTQYFQTDLTKVPEAKGKYHSKLYTYTGSKISDDGKTLYLYYNIDTTVLSPNFVVDFGLPITFSLDDLLGEGTETTEVTNVSDLSARYGKLTYNNGTFTYTPNKILQNIDVLSITLTIDGKAATTNVGVTPATTVYYEESFLLGTGATGWTTTSASLGTQETAVLGARQNEGSTINHYGYDGAYANAGTSTGYITGTKGASTSFTFTGTGFQLYGNSDKASGYVTVMSQGNVNKLYMINTELNGVEGGASSDNQQTDADANKTYYGLPFISETNLEFGTYTVKIKQTNGENPIYLDGVRILNTINDTTEGEGNIYNADKEDNPDFYEVRDFVLHALGVHEIDETIEGNDSQYTDSGPNDRAGLADSISQMAGQVYNHIAAESASAVIVDKSEKFTATDVQDLLDNGPKNELYLYNGQTLIFKFNTNRVAQLGLKAPTGTASFTIKGTDSTLTGLATSVDMFYEIAAQGNATNGMTVTITNTGANVLSVTLLKICDDPNAAFLPLTQADIEDVLMDLYNVSDVEPPVKPSEPVKPEIPSEPSKPTEPEIPSEPSKPTKPVEPQEPTKPGKPEKPEKPEKPAKPGQNKPGKPAEKQKDAKLKITYVNLLGKKVGSATLTKTGTANQRCTFSASEIIGNAPARRNALWFLPVVVPYGGNVSIVVPVI